MSGLEKIISQILADAQKEAEAILEDAEKEADRLLCETRKELQRMQSEAELEQERRRTASLERVRSTAELRRRQQVLETKQGIIAEVLEKAYERLLSMDEEAYFSMLTGLLRRFVLPKAGEIYFSERDRKRMPEYFRDELTAIAGEKGGSLTMGSEAKPIDGGFVLVYGGVEENAAFRALFAEKKDELTDQVQKMLF